MSDPRLCSIHLEAMPRREEFRRARELLLSARGQQTVAFDARHFAEAADRQEGPGDVPAAARSRYRLASRDTVYTLKIGLNTIGRMPDNDVAILDGSISRRHCAILVHAGDGCEVHDTASKNGTFVNGERVTEPRGLKPGDEIRLCDHKLILLTDDGAAPAADPDPDGGKTFVE